MSVLLFALLSVSSIAGAQSAQEWYNKGVDETNLDKKIEYFTKAIELNPGYAKAYNNRGLAYYYLGRYDEAIVDLKKACDMGEDEACKAL